MTEMNSAFFTTTEVRRKIVLMALSASPPHFLLLPKKKNMNMEKKILITRQAWAKKTSHRLKVEHTLMMMTLAFLAIVEMERIKATRLVRHRIPRREVAKHEYQAFVSTGILNDNDDDDDATANQHGAIVMYKRSNTTSSTRTPAKSMIARSPKNRKTVEMKAKQLAKRAKTTREKALAIKILEKISSDAAEREEE
jgi:hypothetical protein